MEMRDIPVCAALMKVDMVALNFYGFKSEGLTIYFALFAYTSNFLSEVYYHKNQNRQLLL